MQGGDIGASTQGADFGEAPCFQVQYSFKSTCSRVPCLQQFSGNHKNVKITLVMNGPSAERLTFWLVEVLIHHRVAQEVNVSAAKHVNHAYRKMLIM